MAREHEVLGVPVKASAQEIRRAYYKKALQLHPDVSKSPDAHEAFVELSLAYETLIRTRTGRVFNQQRGGFVKVRPDTGSRVHDERKTWRAAARARASKHAQMEYEAFRKSKYYSTFMMADKLADALNWAVWGFIFLVLPIGGFIFKGATGLVTGLIVIFMTVPGWGPFLMKRFKNEW